MAHRVVGLFSILTSSEKKETKQPANPREGWEDGTPPPERDFEGCENRKRNKKTDGASSRRPMVCCPAQQPSGDDPGAKNPATTALWIGRDLLPPTSFLFEQV